MNIICPKCNSSINIDISEAIDENGEVYRCKKCGYHVRYVTE